MEDVFEALSTDLKVSAGFFNESETPFLRLRLGPDPADCEAPVLVHAMAGVALIDSVDSGGLILILCCDPCFLLWF